MDLQSLSVFLSSNGLAVLIIVAIGIGGYKILAPYFKQRLENNIAFQKKENENHFEALQETREVNMKILGQLDTLNVTNTEISKTNTELSRTNRKLVESIDVRFSVMETSVQDINDKVDGIIEAVGSKNLA